MQRMIVVCALKDRGGGAGERRREVDPVSFARGEAREVDVPGAGDLWGQIYAVVEEGDARGLTALMGIA